VRVCVGLTIHQMLCSNSAVQSFKAPVNKLRACTSFIHVQDQTKGSSETCKSAGTTHAYVLVVMHACMHICIHIYTYNRWKGRWKPCSCCLSSTATWSNLRRRARLKSKDCICKRTCMRVQFLPAMMSTF
jgi:hypothetical protein